MGYVIISWLKRVPNKALKCNAFSQEEEVRRFLFWYIKLVKTPDGHGLESNPEMPEAFRAYFHDRFA